MHWNNDKDCKICCRDGGVECHLATEAYLGYDVSKLTHELGINLGVLRSQVANESSINRFMSFDAIVRVDT